MSITGSETLAPSATAVDPAPATADLTPPAVDPTPATADFPPTAGGPSPATPRRTLSAGGPYLATTVETPDGPFSVVLGPNALLASGWTADVASLVALIHPSLRPPLDEVREVGHLRVIGDSAEGGASSGADSSTGTDTGSDSDSGADNDLLRDVVAAVAAYYDGDLGAPGRIPVRQKSGDFRMHAWDVLRAVDPGEQITYSEYAARSGRPAAVRAAAGACALNAAALFVPCHRVLRTDGTLGGFRYGLAIKERLLHREATAAA